MIDYIIDFIQSDNGILCDHVCDDLDIKIDYECSKLYDMVNEKFIPKSFEEVVEAVRNRICVAISSYKENP